MDPLGENDWEADYTGSDFEDEDYEDDEDSDFENEEEKEIQKFKNMINSELKSVQFEGLLGIRRILSAGEHCNSFSLSLLLTIY